MIDARTQNIISPPTGVVSWTSPHQSLSGVSCASGSPSRSKAKPGLSNTSGAVVSTTSSSTATANSPLARSISAASSLRLTSGRPFSTSMSMQFSSKPTSPTSLVVWTASAKKSSARRSPMLSLQTSSSDGLVAGSSNGRTPVSNSGNPGSSPGLASNSLLPLARQIGGLWA